MPPATRPTARSSGLFNLKGCLLAIGLAGLSVAGRAALQSLSPSIGPYIFLFPAIVLAGLFWGTLPATLAVIIGGWLTSLVGIVPRPFSPPLLNANNLNLLLYLPACVIVLWATSRLRRSTELAERAQLRLAEIFRQFPGAATVLEGETGRLILNSQHSSNVLGHDVRFVGNQVVDMAHYGGIHTDGRPYSADEYPIVRAYKYGEATSAESLRYRRPDGSIVELEVYAGPVRNADGHIVAAVGTALDVTERVQAERRLRESEAAYRTASERLRAAIDAGGLGVWEIDLETDEMTVDATMAAMLGLPAKPAQFSRAQLRAMVHQDDRAAVRQTLQAAIAAGGVYADECRLRLPNGAVRWVVSHGTVLPDLKKIVGVLRDVTEAREREKALQDALAARDILMHEADHRIKNSLQLVISLLTLQLGKADNMATRNLLSDAIARVDAIASAHRALEYSPDLKSIEIDNMLGDLCQRLGALNPAISLHCQATTGLSLDAEKAIPLTLIASELLTNALRHAFPVGEPGNVTLSLACDGGALHLTITDYGCGLPPGSTRVGLGSAVITALARQIGAEVTTNTAPGRGVSVLIRLALAQNAVCDADHQSYAQQGR